MARIINISAYKAAAAVSIVMALVIFSTVVVRYQKPVDIEKTCSVVKLPLVNNITSCSLVDQILKSLDSEGYTVVTLEDSKYSGGVIRARFDRRILEVANFRINDGADSGVAHFKFINGYLSSIIYFPTKLDIALKLYPEVISKGITVKHLTDYQGKKYISWTDEHLETYVTWWISKFS